MDAMGVGAAGLDDPVPTARLGDARERPLEIAFSLFEDYAAWIADDRHPAATELTNDNELFHRNSYRRSKPFHCHMSAKTSPFGEPLNKSPARAAYAMACALPPDGSQRGGTSIH